MRTKIRDLVVDLRNNMACGHGYEVVANAINTLGGLEYRYDNVKYPVLDYGRFTLPKVDNTPSNLAEALLWKLGKWNTYTDFVDEFKSQDQPVGYNLVLSAFAKHLARPDAEPIFDQHALRAIWAIGNLDSAQESDCERFLCKENEKKLWKQTGGGRTATSCYQLFKNSVRGICADTGLSSKELDNLLMPLGQALKDITSGGDDFRRIVRGEH